MLTKLKSELKSNANPEKAKVLQGFFKTGKGQYGEGDIFLGITVPKQRKIAKEFYDLKLNDVLQLLKSPIHEERLTSLLILVDRYEKTNDHRFVKFYLKNAKYVNNWDLVDLSAPKILGSYLLNLKNRKILYTLARSNNLWEKRISIISTFALIRDNQLDDTLKISKILLNDTHDLTHKAVGWMLREVGKRDEKLLIKFLKENYDDLPRTTLRYAIEKFDEKRRKGMLKGRF
ncbi:DNA alkylation repair protein [archaeon]|nr:DNA alkylation repair protein [archaeon]